MVYVFWAWKWTIVYFSNMKIISIFGKIHFFNVDSESFLKCWSTQWSSRKEEIATSIFPQKSTFMAYQFCPQSPFLKSLESLETFFFKMSDYLTRNSKLYIPSTWLCMQKMLNHGLNHGFFLLLFKLISCPIHWILCVLAYLNFILEF